MVSKLPDVAEKQNNLPNSIDFPGMKRRIKKADENASFSLETYGVKKEVLSYLKKLIWAEDIETDEEVYAMMERVSRTNNMTLEPHGVTGLIATLRARTKHAISPTDIVVVMETAHPDKFPTALREAHITVPQKSKHVVLTKLGKTLLSHMKKPKALGVNLLTIAKKIKSISY